jgi:NAD-dependent deacetylase
LPRELGEHWERGRAVGVEQRSLLVCPHSERPTRPHVLWFDESYDEVRFRFESTLDAVARARLVIVVGTSGNTNLPSMIVQHAARAATPLLVINRDPSSFSELAESRPTGYFVRGPAGEILPPLVDVLLDGELASA